ncbi:MAG TPA: lipoprotein [Chitinolyticbacter sp.]|nr:lipoprotein [Chitinolyticbacter sp.]
MLLAALTLAACGFKGDLYLPKGQTPRPAIQTKKSPPSVTPLPTPQAVPASAVELTPLVQ